MNINSIRPPTATLGSHGVTKLRIQFLGGTGTVTGSKYLLEQAGRRLLVDCGGVRARLPRIARALKTGPTMAFDGPPALNFVPSKCTVVHVGAGP